MTTEDYDDKPYGICPAPGACCPDQPNCHHCRPELCPECGAKMAKWRCVSQSADARWELGEEHWRCRCGHEEKVK